MTPLDRLARIGPLLASCLALAACGKPDVPGAGKPSGLAAVRKVPVEVTTLAPRSLEYSIRTVGRLEAKDVVRVPARVAGIVENLRFEAGTAVSAGQVLARIDAERYRLALAREEARVQQAEAAATEAENLARRRAELASSAAGIVSAEDVTNAALRADSAKAELAAARAARDMAAKDLRDSEVRAEIAGRVEQRLVAAGQHVDAGDAVATIVDSSRLRLVFHVTETESTRLGASPRVTFVVKALPGRSFDARLFHVGQSAESGTRQVECQAWVESPPEELKAGFFAEVEIAVGGNPNALLVPQSAAQPTERGFVGYVVDDAGVAHERKLTLGLSTPTGEVEILEGFAEGDRAVVKGAAALREGALVQVAGSPAP